MIRYHTSDILFLAKNALCIHTFLQSKQLAFYDINKDWQKIKISAANKQNREG
jgi:hypothetical protein